MSLNSRTSVRDSPPNVASETNISPKERSPFKKLSQVFFSKSSSKEEGLTMNAVRVSPPNAVEDVNSSPKSRSPLKKLTGLFSNSPPKAESSSAVTFKTLMKLNSQLFNSSPVNNNGELKEPTSQNNLLGVNKSPVSGQFEKSKSIIFARSPANSLRLPTLALNSDSMVSGSETKSKLHLPNFLKRKSIFGISSKSIKSFEADNEYFDEVNGFEIENVIIKFPFGIISPYSYFKKIWDLLMALILAYFFMVLPVRLCFSRTHAMFSDDASFDYEDAWLPFDILCDLLLVFDILINFFSAFESEVGFLVSSRVGIAKEYIKGWFVCDLISVFPINRNIFSIQHTHFEDPHFNMTNYKIWRVVRLIKLIRVFKLNDTIDRIFSLMTLNLDKISVIKFVSFILVFINFTSCLWSIIAEVKPHTSWLELEDLQNLDLMSRYVASIYFMLTILLTIGYGDIHPNHFDERMWGVICMLFGLFIYGYIISSLANSFAKLNQVKNAHEAKLFFYGEWAKTFKIPYETLELILDTVGSESNKKNGYSMDALHSASALLQGLPAGLSTEIFKYVFKDSLNQIEFLQHKPKNFLTKLIPILNHTNFKEKDVIYKQGDPALEVFLLIKGRVISKCLDKRGKERTQIFVEGTLFGEADILRKRSRPANVRAETDCELWRIEKKQFLELLDQFPEIYKEVKDLLEVKEKYRVPQTTRYLQRTPITHLKSNIHFHDINPYGITKESPTWSTMFLRSASKKSSWNSNPFETTELEPSSPTLEVFRPERGSILSEASLPGLARALFSRKMRHSKNHGHRARKSINPGKSENSTQIFISNFNNKTSHNSPPMNPSKNTTKRARPITEWEVAFQAKKKLLEELQTKNFEITNTSEIDQVLNGIESIGIMKEKMIKEKEYLQQELDTSISHVEGMLLALKQFDKSLKMMIKDQTKQ